MSGRIRFRWAGVVALAACLAWGAAPVQADYLAYAVGKKGEKPLPEDVLSITKKNAKHLVNVRWSEYAGPRIRVGVLEADNQSSVASYSFSGAGGSASYEAGAEKVPVNGIEAILADVLTRTGRFQVLTRTELGEVLGEQDLAASGRVSKPSGAKTGKVLGADYLVQVVVNSYEPNVSGKKGGLGGFSRRLRAFGGVKGGKSKSYVSMTFRIIDAETSEIVASRIVEASISEMNLGFGAVGWGGGGALGGFLSGYAKTPIGQAVIAAVNAGVVELVKELGNRPLVGSVIKVNDDGTVLVNLGEGLVNPGDRLTASSKGEEIVDPDTGLSLGSEDETLGTVEITQVKEKFSYARAVDFDVSRLSRGDRLVSQAPPPKLEFGPPWK